MSCFTGSTKAAAVSMESRDVADRAAELFWVKRLLTVDMVRAAVVGNSLRSTDGIDYDALRNKLVASIDAAFQARDNS